MGEVGERRKKERRKGRKKVGRKEGGRKSLVSGGDLNWEFRQPLPGAKCRSI